MAKLIPLKTLGKKDEIGYIKYGAIIRALLQHPNQPEHRGVNYDYLIKVKRVYDVLDTVDKADKMVLEDADYEFLKDCVVGYLYTHAHPNILTFIEDIKNAEHITTDNPKAEKKKKKKD